MEAASPALVIDRAPEQERRIQRDGLIIIISQACNVVLCLGITYLLLQQRILNFNRAYATLPLVAAGVGLYAMYVQIRWRRINRRMRNLSLRLAPEGVTYTSDAGTFSAPWSAVRRIRLQERRLSADHLIVDVTDWGGPISEGGRVCRLALAIDHCDLDELHIKRSIHQFSGGSVMAVRS